MTLMNREAVVTALLELLRNHPTLATLGVTSGYPRDFMKPETMWVDGDDGDLDVPTSKAGRLERADVFDLKWFVQVTGKATLDLTRIRLGEIRSVMDDVLADHPTLDDVEGLMFIKLGNVKGSCGELPG